MRPRWSSPTPFAGGWVEHECPRCHRTVELPLGQLCLACRGEIDRKAAKWGALSGFVAALVVGAYLTLRMASTPATRQVQAVAIVVVLLLVNVIVRRAVRELMK